MSSVARTKSTSKPPPGIVEALKSKTAALESATALLKAVRVVERDALDTYSRRLDRLSFVATRDGKGLPKPKGDQFPRCWWNVKPSGDYEADCVTGEKLALEYLAFEADDKGGPGHLQHIVMDMPRKLTGIEIGFLVSVSYAAGAGIEEARRVSAYWERCRAAA